MLGYLRRLVTTGAAYQSAEIVAKGIALVTLPLYLRHVDSAEYGAYSVLLTSVILASIFLRAGVGEAFVRFYFDDHDLARRERVARTATAFVAWTTTAAALLALLFAGRLSKLILGSEDAGLLDCAVLGLWAFTNLEMAYAQLRVDERARAYMIASGANVAMTVIFTVTLVVLAGEGAKGLLLGNFGASAVVVLGLWVTLGRRFSLRARRGDLAAMLRFGLPTIPADASVYGLQVVDRVYLLRDYSKHAAGAYAYALQLATVVFVFVRGFQYAWPPLAYSIDSDVEASQLYSLVTTYFVLATGLVVAAVALLGRWMVRLLAPAEYFDAYKALPWLALGWSLYGLYLVFIVITGRARVTQRNFPAAATGLGVNVALLLLLVPASAAGLGLAGAGLALCGAYVAMIGVIYALTRRLFQVGFELGRLVALVAILGGVAVSGELLLPASGAGGLLLRVLWLGLIPVALRVSGFFSERERVRAVALAGQARRRIVALRDQGAEVEAYAEDPLRDI
jgi:O-antigen/teichoic acid export membrane protein